MYYYIIFHTKQINAPLLLKILTCKNLFVAYNIDYVSLSPII
jgi:hypothetical protein